MLKSATVGALALAAATHAAPAALFLPPIRNAISPRLAGLGAPGHVALTFDHGPTPKRPRASSPCSAAMTCRPRSSSWAAA